MSLLPASPCDPATLAAEVRDLATEAYRTLNDPFVRARHVRELTQRISRLQRKVRRLPASDLSLWLENLRRQVESRTGTFEGALSAPQTVDSRSN